MDNFGLITTPMMQRMISFRVFFNSRSKNSLLKMISNGSVLKEALWLDESAVPK